MTKKEMLEKYRQYRRENDNRKPDRVVIEYHWENEPKTHLYGIIPIVPELEMQALAQTPDDELFLFYVPSLKALLGLVKPHNGTEFIIDKCHEFYRSTD